MTDQTNPFEAAIAALEARRAELVEQIDADIATLKGMAERTGTVLSASSPQSTGGTGKIESDTFFSMSIADAAAKYLRMVNKKPQPTNAIIDALERGGLKRSAYTTVYSILSRRRDKVGDVVNVNGDWALQEWYGAVKPKTKKKKGDETESAVLSQSDEDAVAEDEIKQAEAAAGVKVAS
jgi:hypothetical protein